MHRVSTGKIAHTIVLDAGPIIANDPPISTLLRSCEIIVTSPAVLAEIKDSKTREWVSTTLEPFVTQRNPRTSSVEVVSKFATQTGDAAVLSRVDLLVAALAYEIECERNKGDWRLRKKPGQKTINGQPPPELKTSSVAEISEAEPSLSESQNVDEASQDEPALPDLSSNPSSQPRSQRPQTTEAISTSSPAVEEELDPELDDAASPSREEISNELDNSDGDDAGWITPSNLKKKQSTSTNSSSTSTGDPFSMQVAVITGDFALQNLLLQMNLNIMSSGLSRIKQIKTWILRCHACFNISKDITKQFCPRCGGATLNRVSCSTSQDGAFRIHLKKGWQYNNRGDKFSIPKPISGSASGRRLEGGGKNHWGSSLLLCEDQKEYVQARQDSERENRRMAKDMFDQDFLPGILSGRRVDGKAPGLKVGAGRTVNARNRR